MVTAEAFNVSQNPWPLLQLRQKNKGSWAFPWVGVGVTVLSVSSALMVGARGTIRGPHFPVHTYEIPRLRERGTITLITLMSPSYT